MLDTLMTGGGDYRARARRGPIDFTDFAPYVQPSLLSFDPVDVNTMIAGSRDAGPLHQPRRRRHLEHNDEQQRQHEQSGRAAGRTSSTTTGNAGSRTRLSATQGRGVWRVNYASGPPAENEICPDSDGHLES